jgi:hypothetical protein
MFGWGRKRGRHHVELSASQAVQPEDDQALDEAAAEEPGAGPFDEADAVEDSLPRLDFGSVRLPVPDGAQLQVEVDPSGPVRAVHLLTPIGRLTVSAFAAPRSSGLWKDVRGELTAQLRNDGATVRSENGEWGQELVASSGEVALRFVGVDGPRWMLRGVAAGPTEHAEAVTAMLRDVVRGTVVVRGSQAMPVRTPLPIELPPAIAKHIQTSDGNLAVQ